MKELYAQMFSKIRRDYEGSSEKGLFIDYIMRQSFSSRRTISDAVLEDTDLPQSDADNVQYRLLEQP